MSERSEAAQAILSIPLMREIFAEFEEAAVNACLYAKYDDHEARQAHAAEARAVRNVLSKLEAIANEGQPKPVRKAPA